MQSPNQRVWGEVQYGVTALTASATLTLAQTGIVMVDSTLGAVVLTLPAAATCTGLGYHIRLYSGAASLTVNPAGTEQIDRAGAGVGWTSASNNASFCIYSDGVGWFRCGIGTWT